MRVPFFKLWRAFPELDKFGDDACRTYIREAMRTHELGSIMVGMAAFAVFCFVTVVVGWLMWLLAHVVEVSSIFMAVIWLSVPIVSGAIAAFSIRDIWVKKIVLERLRGVQCAGCSYSLLGLVVVDGGVVCPECGDRFDLEMRGVSCADMMSPAAPESREHGPE